MEQKQFEEIRGWLKVICFMLIMIVFILGFK